jgi:photosystem II stability/assembly factor-like uncharacterized protein
MRSSSCRVVLALVVALIVSGVALPSSALATISTGDGVWKWQNPLPQGNSINGAFFLDAQAGWLVGDRGTIIHTGDGGGSWTSQQSGTTFRLKSVTFTDELHGWAVGGYAPGAADNINVWDSTPDCIVVTTDGGVTWRGQNPGFTGVNPRMNVDLDCVRFVDDQHGWAVGSYYYETLILATSDGGKTWLRQGPHTDKFGLHSVFFADENRGWAVGSDVTDSTQGTILVTTDGGAHWAARAAAPEADTSWGYYSLNSVWFTDAQHGWAAGDYGLLTQTTDGGETWTPAARRTSENLRSVYFSDADHGVALGWEGAVLRTEDGGATWSLQNIGSPNVLTTTLCFGDAQTGWVMGTQYGAWPDTGALCCYVRQTTDGGATWAPPASYVTADLKDVSFVSRTQGWAVGENGTIMVTADGGEAWTTQAPPVAAGLNGVDFVDALTGWAVGDGGTIVATVDGGTTWHQQPSPSGVSLRAVSFIDAQRGWAAGGSTVLATDDGGLTWVDSSVNDGTWTPDIESVSFVNATHGWVAGYAPAQVGGDPGCVFATTDGGVTWERQFNERRIHSVFFIDEDYGWLAGDGKLLRRTTDGGATWKACGIITEYSDDTSLRDVMAIDRTHGWAVGTKGYILATSDGEHWVEENAGAKRVLNGVSFVDEGHGWVVGEGGMILEDPGPLCRAPNSCVVRRGQIATIKCLVSDAAAVKVNVTIRIRNSRGRIVQRLDLKGRAPNRVLKASFRCRLVRGTYHFYVYASDSAGSKAAVPAINKLIVR